MTGGAFFPAAHVDDYELDELGQVGTGHAVQWIGTPGVKGPKWGKLPLLTVGMLGIQCVWSIEMGYGGRGLALIAASPYLLDLGLSKSYMSLVFMAGPLSGLIVQPLIGVLADRSTSRLGRRRPFMLAGCGICATAMMILGWAREISALLGGGDGFAIALAVFAIYLIDFSINAVMSTDRALVVDTLSPEKQEEGSAWAGRMFGFGSVAGFFIGNLDLPPVFPWLGKNQLQILSFITSAILLVAHAFTSWAVTERVLLRDDRPSSNSGLLASLKVIRDNIFSLPPGIRTVCIVQFFASLSWFPVLFFTTVWVSEIYKSQPGVDHDSPTLNSDAVRAGARSLFFQSLVNIACSVGIPFLVAESGVQAASGAGAYRTLNGSAVDPPRSALWKRAQEEIADGGWIKRGVGWAKGVMVRVKDGDPVVRLPIKGLTVVRVWWISQFVFAGTMAASWFVHTVGGAYFIIGVTGFCWAMAQWAPYALLGELILLEGQQERDAASTPHPVLFQSRPSDDSIHRSIDGMEVPAYASSGPASTRPTPRHSRHNSRPDLTVETQLKSPEPSPLVPAQPRFSEENEVSLVLHHHPEDDSDSDSDIGRSSPHPRTPSPRMPGKSGKDTADKAGVILGIHNVFLVLPQFIVTILSAIIFHMMEPDNPATPKHPGTTIPIVGNITAVDGASDGVERFVTRLLEKREGLVEASSSDAVGVIFRIGGMSAAIGAFICMRLARSWRRGEGL